MPIDPNLPLELDNGVAVEFVRYNNNHTLIQVRLPAGQHYSRQVQEEREEEGFDIVSCTWWYEVDTGFWHTGNAQRHFVLRNRHVPKQVRNWDMYGPWFEGDIDLREILLGSSGVCWRKELPIPERRPNNRGVLGFANYRWKYALDHDHEFYKTPRFVAMQLAGLAQPDE